MVGPAQSLTDEFVRISRRELSQTLERIETAVGKLAPEDVWRRAHDNENAVGNLLLHLAGNVRQWIVSGLGGASDARDRASEFAERRELPAADLLAVLRETVREADAVIASLSPEDLLAPRPIQGFEVSGMYVVYHVVEHFGQHAGQILWIAKNRSGEDLGFYRHLNATGRASGSEP